MSRRGTTIIDNSIRFPENMNIHEHKAPTDESIRLMEEMHDKALKNIIAKVKVEDNLVNGEVFCCEQPWNANDLKLIYKFKINGKEFTLEQEISTRDIGWDEQRKIADLSLRMENKLKAVMLWYTLKYFTAIAYEKIMGEKPPEQIFNR